MAVVEIILQARDNTAAGVNSARASLAGLSGATRTAAGTSVAYTATQQAQAGSTQSLAVLTARLEQAQLRATLAGQSAAQRVATLTARHTALSRSTREAGITTEELTRRQTALARAEEQLTRATQAYTRESDRAFASQRRRSASGGGVGLGPALPRTFAGFTQQGIMQGAGALGVATAGPELIGQLNQLANAGQDVQASLDGTRASLGALLQDQRRGNEIFERGIAAGRALGETQENSAAAIRAASQIIRTSQSPIESIVETLARLQVLSPEQTLGEASLALRELSGGETESLVQRFEVTRSAANEMKREIQGGADAVQVLGRYLDSIGVDSGTLSARLQGAAGEQRRYNVAIEDLQVKLNDLVASSGWRSFLPGLIENTTESITDIQSFAAAANTALANMVPQKTKDDLAAIGDFEEWLSDRVQRAASAAGSFVGANLGIAPDRRLAAAEARTARDDRSLMSRAGTVPAPQTMTIPSQAAMFAGFNPGARQAVTWTGNVIVQGNVTTQQDLVDAVHRGFEQKRAQNGYEAYP